MYGTLREIDLGSLLEFIADTQKSGTLLIELTNQAKEEQSLTFWLLFFYSGHIIYAGPDTKNPLQRLQDYLRRYKAESSLKNLPSIEYSSYYSDISQLQQLPEYKYIWLLLQQHFLPIEQGKRIIYNLIKETLFDVMTLIDGHFIFQRETTIQPILESFEIGSLVSQVRQERQQWNQLYPYIVSPEQRPMLIQAQALEKALTGSAYRSLMKACQGQLSLRRIARHLNKDLVTIAQALYPYIRQGWFQLLDSPLSTTQSVPESHTLRVVCIHPDYRVNLNLEQILKQYHYHPIIFDDPIAGISDIVKNPPHRILTALEMATLSGEDVASLLQGITNWKIPPIIVLTPKSLAPYRLRRANLLGVQTILRQPFQESDLLGALQENA